MNCPNGSPGIVIDSGDVPGRVPDARQRFQAGIGNYFHASKTIPLVIATHPHSDHIGNLAWLFGQFEIRAYLDNGQPPRKASRTFRSLEVAVNSEVAADGTRRLNPDSAIEPLEPCPGSRVSLKILGPRRRWGDCADDPNNCSVVVRMDYGKTSYLFTGDSEREAEERYLGDPAARGLLDADVLKVAHHGSETSSSRGFLAAVSPKVVVVSAGPPGQFTNRNYRHPRLATVAALMSAMPHALLRPASDFRVFDSRRNLWTSLRTDLPLYVTASDGDVVIRSDGENLLLPGQRPP
ncbi:MAG: MBL fold metallo-hydrolase [Nitrospirae bacterium]|nr:MBL fold metallo-hydrolase [Nitrospirota bacterium]